MAIFNKIIKYHLIVYYHSFSFSLYYKDCNVTDLPYLIWQQLFTPRKIRFDFLTVINSLYVLGEVNSKTESILILCEELLQMAPDLCNDWVSVCTVVLDGEIVPVSFPSLIGTGDNPGPAWLSL